MEGSGQLLASAGVAVLIFVGYEIGKSLAAKSQESVDKGITNQWGTDPVVKERHDRKLMEHQKYPSCQIWNETYQLFLDTGDSAADADQNVCFTKYQLDSHGFDTTNPRYLKDDKTTTYFKEDPLSSSEPPGTCYFKFPGDTDWSTFLNAEAVISAPNRSARLCFAAGENAGMAGQLFENARGELIFPPDVSFGSDLHTPRCEVWGQVPLSGVDIPKKFASNPPEAFGWNVFTTSGTDPTSCTAASKTYGSTRQVTPEHFVFQNPYNGVMEQVKNTIF
jgi:hypothetical protein